MSKFFHAFASRLLKAKHIKGLAFFQSKAASEAFRLDKLVFFFFFLKKKAAHSIVQEMHALKSNNFEKKSLTKRKMTFACLLSKLSTNLLQNSEILE